VFVLDMRIPDRIRRDDNATCEGEPVHNDRVDFLFCASSPSPKMRKDMGSRERIAMLGKHC
jgi:hypothetical protein